jgi:hypothetical protein
MCTAQPGWRVLVKCPEGPSEGAGFSLTRLNVAFWAIATDTDSTWASVVGAPWGDEIVLLPYDWEIFGIYAPDSVIEGEALELLDFDDRTDEAAYCERHNLSPHIDPEVNNA